jgi:membrane-associated phospholipid phosphatase
MEALRTGLPEWAVEAFAVISLLGDLFLIVPVLGLIYLADVASGLSRGDETQPLCSDRTVFLIATVFGGLALVVVLESVFAMPRPPAEYHAISPSEHGFPSGHAMAATVFWGALALWLPIGSRPARLAVGATVVPLVALSRLALGVHFLIDVVASFAFGVIYLAAVAWLARDRPARAFGGAIVIAVLATVVSGANERAVLALVGTAGAAVGWFVVELPPVRRRLIAGFERLG